MEPKYDLRFGGDEGHPTSAENMTVDAWGKRKRDETCLSSFSIICQGIQEEMYVNIPYIEHVSKNIIISPPGLLQF